MKANMKAICELSNEEYAKYNETYKDLMEAVKDTGKQTWFTNYVKRSGYAHYTFSGDVTDELIKLLGHEPSSNEIIMLVDSGFSHFGASCSINGRHFSGRVNTRYVDKEER